MFAAQKFAMNTTATAAKAGSSVRANITISKTTTIIKG